MSLTQYYTATTLDGFIADPNHSLDWLFTRDQDRGGLLNYAEFIAGVGALAMGSTTYSGSSTTSSRSGPGGVEVAVRHPLLGLHPPAADGRADRPGRVHERGRGSRAPGLIAAAGGKNVWIVGGETSPASSLDAPAGRGHRLHRAGDAGGGSTAAAAPARAAPGGARPEP